MKIIGRLLAIVGYLLFLMLIVLYIIKFSLDKVMNNTMDVSFNNPWIILVLSVVFMIGGKLIEARADKKNHKEVKVVNISENKKINRRINKREIGIYLCMIPSILYIFIMIVLAIYKQSDICMIYCIDTILSKIIICLVIALSVFLIYVQIKKIRGNDLTYWRYRFELRKIGLILLVMSILINCISPSLVYYVLIGIIDGLVLIALSLIGAIK